MQIGDVNSWSSDEVGQVTKFISEVGQDIIPGFVDLQVNGYKGVDYSSDGLTKDDIRRLWHILHNRRS